MPLLFWRHIRNILGNLKRVLLSPRKLKKKDWESGDLGEYDNFDNGVPKRKRTKYLSSLEKNFNEIYFAIRSNKREKGKKPLKVENTLCFSEDINEI